MNPIIGKQITKIRDYLSQDTVVIGLKDDRPVIESYSYDGAILDVEDVADWLVENMSDVLIRKLNQKIKADSTLPYELPVGTTGLISKSEEQQLHQLNKTYKIYLDQTNKE